MRANKPATTAYHEAGHAVAAFFLDLSIGRGGVTIVPKDRSAGVTQIHLQLTEDPELAAAPRTRVRIERFAVMSLACIMHEGLRPSSPPRNCACR